MKKCLSLYSSLFITTYTSLVLRTTLAYSHQSSGRLCKTCLQRRSGSCSGRGSGNCSSLAQQRHQLPTVVHCHGCCSTGGKYIIKTQFRCKWETKWTATLVSSSWRSVRACENDIDRTTEGKLTVTATNALPFHKDIGNSFLTSPFSESWLQLSAITFAQWLKR